MAKFSRRRLAREVVRLVREQPNRRAATINQLAAYLIVHKQATRLDLLMRDIADELYLQEGRLEATAVHVFDLTQQTRAAIAAMLKDATGATKVELETRKDPSLLGGVIIRTPRQELDVSVRTQLNALVAGGTDT